MRSEQIARALGIAAVIAMGLSSLPLRAEKLIWIEMCDPVHPGRRMPLPGQPEEDRRACHSACPMPGRRQVMRSA